MQTVLPLVLLALCVLGLAGLLVAIGYVFNPRRPNPVKQMPYESGMDPIHDTRRRFHVRFYLLAIAFLVFDVELLLLYPWAVVFRQTSKLGPPEVSSFSEASPSPVPVEVPGEAGRVAETQESSRPNRPSVAERPPGLFWGGMVFIGLLVLGLIYDWRKRVFQWR